MEYLTKDELAVGMRSRIDSDIIWEIIYLFHNVKDLANERNRTLHSADPDSLYFILKNDYYQMEKYTTICTNKKYENETFVVLKTIDFDGDTHYQLYVYGKDEINFTKDNTVLFETTDRWKGSKILKTTDKKVGMFERIKSFKDFN